MNDCDHVKIAIYSFIFSKSSPSLLLVTYNHMLSHHNLLIGLYSMLIKLFLSHTLLGGKMQIFINYKKLKKILFLAEGDSYHKYHKVKIIGQVNLVRIGLSKKKKLFI